MNVNTIEVVRKLLGSKTVAGGILLVVGLFIKDNPDIEVLVQGWLDVAVAALGVVGSALLLWGRATAKGPIIGPASFYDPYMKAAEELLVKPNQPPPPGGPV